MSSSKPFINARRGCVLTLLVLVSPGSMRAQARGRAPAGPPPTPKAAVPVDLTGYWVSIVTEDWRWRMVTPAKGDYASVPLNAEGKKVADGWDAAQDEAAGEQCKPCGAPGLMRLPGRVHIYWERRHVFASGYGCGNSNPHVSLWRPNRHSGRTIVAGRLHRSLGDNAHWTDYFRAFDGGVPSGALKVVTTHLRPGYLRKNGVPYSENTILTEYYNATKEPDSDQWLIVTTIVNDPKYLNQPFITSTHFKKEAGDAKWNPTPCRAR